MSPPRFSACSKGATLRREPEVKRPRHDRDRAKANPGKFNMASRSTWRPVQHGVLFNTHGRCYGYCAFFEHLFEEEQRRNSVMSQAKRPSKGKRRSKAVPVLGLAGVSLAVVGAGASASTGGSVADMSSPNTAPRQVVTLGDEEISDVSLSTFYVFDKENARTNELGQQFARGGCGRGCGGCRGCRGCRGCGRGCGGCGGCGWCLSTGGCGLC